jgi:hypothetical protein
MNTPTVNFGVVLHHLGQYHKLVHALATSPLVVTNDFTYAAPIYKGSDKIKAALADANNALEKFDVYFLHALADEAERVRFARAFHAAYLRKFPASERTDLFLASGEVLKFSFELVPPSALEQPGAALDAISRTPHDSAVLAKLQAGEPIDRAHLRGDLKIFFDHVMNPRRREVPQVQQAMTELGAEEPYILELVTNGGIPGYIFYTVHPLVHAVGGRLVLLPG